MVAHSNNKHSGGQLPIVLLAFANDYEDNKSKGGGYLRSLRAENRVLSTMFKQRSELCELHVLTNTTARDLINHFITYPNRTVLLHFAGHADSHRLLLESAQTESDFVEGKDLAKFLGQQHGLELVVLNACATHGHVAGLLEAGVNAVVATDQKIHGNIATIFAEFFYQALLSGRTLQQAYDQADAASIWLIAEEYAVVNGMILVKN